MTRQRSWNLLVQEKVPEEMLSRIMAIGGFFSFAATPIGQVAVGPLAVAFGAGSVQWGRSRAAELEADPSIGLTWGQLKARFAVRRA
ncbi:hypothetical protein [Nocardioides sp. zg-DK7169]|uniref:hypothetical protein n=1 Tax=Nocardioides sp. zg-DK7169 TaxID=2736600 RepID=UPI0015555966|nr:hypothetical protein [Nocardioides sp. zg-DK7169]NPC95806.1 hypothetical protein [Nocardioides sp. zg-DK7169]